MVGRVRSGTFSRSPPSLRVFGLVRACSGGRVDSSELARVRSCSSALVGVDGLARSLVPVRVCLRGRPRPSVYVLPSALGCLRAYPSARPLACLSAVVCIRPRLHCARAFAPCVRVSVTRSCAYTCAYARIMQHARVSGSRRSRSSCSGFLASGFSPLNNAQNILKNVLTKSAVRVYSTVEARKGQRSFT